MNFEDIRGTDYEFVGFTKNGRWHRIFHSKKKAARFEQLLKKFGVAYLRHSFSY